MSDTKHHRVQELTAKELAEMVLKLNEPTHIPPCRVCGAPLQATIRGGNRAVVYHCSSPEAEFLADGGGGFGSPAYEHWAKSWFEDGRQTDPYAYELARRLLAVIDTTVLLIEETINEGKEEENK